MEPRAQSLRREQAPSPAAPLDTAHRGQRVALGLGLLAAIGGLVDVGNLVANPLAGAQYGTVLVILVLVSGLFVAVFAEMAGRVTAVSGLVGFEIVRRVLPRRLAEANLLASLVVTLLTCTAEIGGIAQLVGGETGTSARVWAFPVGVVLATVVVALRFHNVDTALGFAGLALVVVFVAIAAAHPHWRQLAHGLVTLPPGRRAGFAKAAVAQVGSMIVPYQLVFFSSGAREERVGADGLRTLRSNAFVGYGAGTLLAAGLVVLAAILARSRALSVNSLVAVSTLPARAGLGAAATAAMLLGMFAALAGAALETALATGYMTAQHRGWAWGMDALPRRAPRFFAVTVGSLLLGGVAMTIKPAVVTLTEFTLVCSTVTLPLTYWPVWVAARDRRLMGEDTSGLLTQGIGGICLLLCALVAVLALPSLVVG